MFMRKFTHFRPRCLTVAVFLLAANSTAVATTFHWNWHESKALAAEQSLRNSNTSKQEKNLLAEAFAEQIRPDMLDYGISSENQLQEKALDTRMEKLDLNGDGNPEVIAQAAPGCSPTGNCSIWIFRKNPKGYELILDSFGQTFTIQHTRKNGFADIVVAMHGSATQSTLKVYRYERPRYRRMDCYEADWSVLEGGIVRELEEPRIIPCVSR